MDNMVSRILTIEFEGKWKNVRDLLGIYQTKFFKLVEGTEGSSPYIEDFLIRRIVKPDESFAEFYKRNEQTYKSCIGRGKRLVYGSTSILRRFMKKRINISEGYPFNEDDSLFRTEGVVSEQKFEIKLRVGQNEFNRQVEEMFYVLCAYLEYEGLSYHHESRTWP